MPRTSFVGRVLTIVGLTLAFIVGCATMGTSAPLLNATEVITVPNVNTGEPMQLEVEKQPTAAADAAAYMFLDCGRRYSEGTVAKVSGVWRDHWCGTSIGNGGNSVSYVRDSSGPICVYYGGALAGCAGKNANAYVGNRSGYQGVVRTITTRI